MCSMANCDRNKASGCCMRVCHSVAYTQTVIDYFHGHMTLTKSATEEDWKTNKPQNNIPEIFFRYFIILFACVHLQLSVPCAERSPSCKDLGKRFLMRYMRFRCKGCRLGRVFHYFWICNKFWFYCFLQKLEGKSQKLKWLGSTSADKTAASNFR